MSDKKGDLLKAMAWPGKNTSVFPECFDSLQVYIEHTQATAASRSKTLKAGLDYNRSYQVRGWALASFGVVLCYIVGSSFPLIPIPGSIRE